MGIISKTELAEIVEILQKSNKGIIVAGKVEENKKYTSISMIGDSRTLLDMISTVLIQLADRMEKMAKLNGDKLMAVDVLQAFFDGTLKAYHENHD